MFLSLRHYITAGNLVGFVIGLEGAREALKGVFTRSGAGFVAGAMACFMSLAHLGFEQRAGEERMRLRAKAS